MRAARYPMLAALAAVVVFITQLDAQVSYDRLLRAAGQAQNWLMYSGTYMSQRYSQLRQIDATNVKNLEQKWLYQSPVIGNWESTPLVVDGIMYFTQRPNDVLSLDAKTGRVFWIYRHNTAPEQKACCGSNNRGVAILGDTVYMGTLDGYLIAINAKSGRARWKIKVAEYMAGYSLTLAPLVIKDKVIIGVGGGGLGIRGFIAAYNAQSGQEKWRLY